MSGPSGVDDMVVSVSPGPAGGRGGATVVVVIMVSPVGAVVDVVGVGVVAVHLKENSTMFRLCAVSRLIV